MRIPVYLPYLLITVGVILSGCTAEQAQEQPRVIPMEDFFRNPEVAGFQLSPDGEHIAFLKPWESRLNVHVQRIGSDEVTRITESTERDIMGYAWANNGRIVYVQDTAGDENWHGYAVEAMDAISAR